MKHCCEMMRSNAENTCDLHTERSDCPDALVDFWPEGQAYGLMIHDGGTSVVTIAYCPWCGKKLPEQPVAAND